MVSASVRLLRPGAYLANSFAAASASLAVITTGLSSQTKQGARMSSCSPTKQLGLLRLFLESETNAAGRKRYERRQQIATKFRSKVAFMTLKDHFSQSSLGVRGLSGTLYSRIALLVVPSPIVRFEIHSVGMRAICRSRRVHSGLQMSRLPIRAFMDSTASIFSSLPCWQVSAPTSPLISLMKTGRRPR